MFMKVLGKDYDGVTRISLDNLKKLANGKRKISSIEITRDETAFFFGDEAYFASGFSTGYAGEGSHGLHKAIMMFNPESIDNNFQNTKIDRLNSSYGWRWNPIDGFEKLF